MQNKFLKAIANFINGDVIFSFANSVIGLIKGPIVLLFVPLFLSQEVQGYWYTFGSLSALSVFADLGFATIVGQFSAHEFAHLRFNEKKQFDGEEFNLERIASLYKFILKWAICVCLIAFPIIFIVGFLILRTHGEGVNWIIPWIIMISTSGFNFVSRISLTFFEGCGKIKNVQIINCICSVVVAGTTIGMLAGRCGLYALVIPSLVNAVISLILMLIVFHRPIVQLLKYKVKYKFNWSKNFLKLIWKYAISWASGYFIFQIYTPLAFLVYDPVQAGKIGITVTLIQACFNISMVWSTVLNPRINMSVANRKWKQAEKYCIQGGIMSMSTYLLGSTMILLAIGIFQSKVELFQRFMGVVPIVIFLIGYFLQVPTNIIATYGRAHKQEPFLVISIVNALLILGSTLGLIFILPIEYIFLGFLGANAVTCIVFVFMFVKNRNKWHESFCKMQDDDIESLRVQLEQEDCNNNEKETILLISEDNITKYNENELEDKEK